MTLITFEGGDGSGKTTAIRIASRILRDLGHTVFSYAEPGSSPLGNIIRGALLESMHRGERINIDRRAQLFLFAASRSQFVNTILRPTMRKNPNAVFLIDRFSDSTIAYQHYGYELDFHKVVSPVVNIAAAGIKPDMTIWFDVEPEIALKRIDIKDRNVIDREGMDFHERVYNAYRAMCNAEPDRWRRVDAAHSPEYVAAEVLGFINEKVPGASL